MFSSLPLALALVLFSLSSNAFPAPFSTPAAGQSIQLRRRNPRCRNPDHWVQWATAQRDVLTTKYGGTMHNKRSSGTNLIVNVGDDTSFYGSLAIGTPAVSYDVILDTGSADLWVAGAGCDINTGCGSVPTFDPSASTTFTNKSTVFSITYGSGQASGNLAQDTIQMAGFSVSNQIFAVCDEVSAGLLNNPVSGLLGLAFRTISSSGATPFWETLVSGGAFDSPVMAFQLSRYIDSTSQQNLQPGGSFTMGFTNSSLYAGAIEFINIPSGQETYWILPLTTITVQGNSIAIPSGSPSYAAIDTGTTLIGGPADAIAAIYAQIPSSVPATSPNGYYNYPCDTQVNVTLSFGGRNWAIDPVDFQLQQLGDNVCVGAFFTLDSGTSAPSWIVGDTFLKNVYSVFRYSPPSVGFADLSKYALSLNGAGGSIPSPTIGSVATVVSATDAGSARVASSAAGSLLSSGFVMSVIANIMAGLLV